MSYEDFISGLQQHIRKDDAVIILEVGWENLRYLVGSAVVIIHDRYHYLDISELACNHAASMLDNPNWRTEIRY